MYQKSYNYDYTAFVFLAVTNINFVKYVSPQNLQQTILPWFHLKFPNPHQINGPQFTVSASGTAVTASGQVCSTWCPKKPEPA